MKLSFVRLLHEPSLEGSVVGRPEAVRRFPDWPRRGDPRSIVAWIEELEEHLGEPVESIEWPR